MPVSDAIGQDYLKNLNKISENIKGIDSIQIQNALGSGGSLSGSLGFNSPVELAGLTPAQFDEMIDNRTKIMSENLKQVSGAVNVRDQLYGITENRRAQQQAARDMFIEGKNAERQEKGFEHSERLQERGFEHESKLQKETLESQERRHRETISAEFERQRQSLGMQDKWHSESLASENKWKAQEMGIRRANLAADQSYRAAQLALEQEAERGRNSRNQEDNSMRLEELRLRAREAKELKDITRENNRNVEVTTTYEKFGKLKEAAQSNMMKKFGKKDGAKRDYFTYTMQQAALLAKPGDAYNTNDYKKLAGGYEKLELGPDHNWYGVKRDKEGKLVEVSPSPLIKHPAPHLIKGQ